MSKFESRPAPPPVPATSDDNVTLYPFKFEGETIITGIFDLIGEDGLSKVEI
jgi:hypothetical protein